MTISKLVVIGVGLIGGSAALALRRNTHVREVIGVGRTCGNLEHALGQGIVDRAYTLHERWQDELGDADLVLVATPVAQCAALFEVMRARLGPRSVVTDAGSTKQDVVKAASELGDALSRFVPAHPIAGTEQSGSAAAFAELFEERTVILTPLPETDQAAIACVRNFWEACGAVVVTLDAHAHDRIFAAVSHLPHLLAATYIAALAEHAECEKMMALAGTGFRDFTRIAAASPEMWRDILLANRNALHSEITAFRASLDRVEAALRSGDAEAVRQFLACAAEVRRNFDRSRETP
ncbi:MAG TPA: prephenate dehydrogenase/arogenate dehydrogenase family protein [Casimicrobiaceae bacterium]|nr:prephenate dehydrogenase/arogenate dehydrogenase family protein [Casimicrobiaceae bacterium]